MLDRLKLPGLGGWSEDPLWGSFYDWSVEHPTAGGMFWRLGLGSELNRLYEAASEIGRLPAGSAVLDIPCGGGVALRGLRAVLEMGRVTAPRGVLTGSAVLNDTGLRTALVRRVGRISGLLGPGATRAEVRAWLAEAGFEDITLTMSGGIGYFRGIRSRDR